MEEGAGRVLVAGRMLDPSDMSTWGAAHVAAFWGVLVLGQELLHYLLMLVDSCSSARIPESGRFLEKLSRKDYAFIYINRMSVPLMMFSLIRTAWLGGLPGGHIRWAAADATVLNTVGSLLCMFLLYDAIYVPFHWALHLRALYPWIHKHHHAQCAPARGNLDASNTHPVEFILGEFIHVLVVALVPAHVYAVGVFIIGGGVLASLNHTRFDISIPGFFNVRAHDKHHHAITVNYGQYAMFVDSLFGTYAPSNSKVVYKSDLKDKRL
jgi:sterol desaturase/sphingolipid hydroxylase (fatty acid hydroxylase superfamily)